MKFPAEVKILEQPSIVMMREEGNNFTIYFEAEDPATGQRLTLKLLRTAAEPVGGDLGQGVLDAIENERAKVEATFAGKK
jgi:hypothetical protein